MAPQEFGECREGFTAKEQDEEQIRFERRDQRQRFRRKQQEEEEEASAKRKKQKGKSWYG